MRRLRPTLEAKDGYVSEATSPKEQDQPVQTAPESSPVAVEAKPAARGSAIAAVALLVGAIGVGVGGWSCLLYTSDAADE